MFIWTCYTFLDLLICISKSDKKHGFFFKSPKKNGFAVRGPTLSALPEYAPDIWPTLHIRWSTVIGQRLTVNLQSIIKNNKRQRTKFINKYILHISVSSVYYSEYMAYAEILIKYWLVCWRVPVYVHVYTFYIIFCIWNIKLKVYSRS